MEIVNLVSAMVSQITSSPAFIYVLIFVNTIIFGWEAVPQLPSRLIPIISIALGGLLFPLFVSTGTVSPDFPHPTLVLVTNGLLAGLVSFAAHAAIITFLRSKFGWPPPADKSAPETNPTTEPKP